MRIPLHVIILMAHWKASGVKRIRCHSGLLKSRPLNLPKQSCRSDLCPSLGQLTNQWAGHTFCFPHPHRWGLKGPNWPCIRNIQKDHPWWSPNIEETLSPENTAPPSGPYSQDTRTSEAVQRYSKYQYNGIWTRNGTGWGVVLPSLFSGGRERDKLFLEINNSEDHWRASPGSSLG